MKFAAACIQITSTHSVSANVDMICPNVARAAREGAQLIALPENAFYFRSEADGAFPAHTEADHPGVVAACEWAKRHSVWILVGSVAIPSDKDKRIHNRSLLINAGGEIVARYDKIHLFDVDVGDGQGYRESSYTVPGEEAVVAKTPWGGIGLSVCYDLRFPQLYQHLAENGAGILTVPSAFTKVTGEAHWHVLLRARAIETGCFVIAPAQVGTHPGGRETYGHSLIISPWGEVLADGGDAPCTITAEIDMKQVDEARGKIPCLKHRRAFA